MQNSEQFILFLQSSITPVALISGVGLLLLTLTNRLARTIDRSRKLIQLIEKEDANSQERLKNELGIMFKRSRFLRNSIGSIVVSMFLNALIIPLLFFMSLYNIDLRLGGYALFFTSIVSILVGLIYLMRDIALTLKALKMDVSEHLDVK
jgi:DNA-binding XRE family transcriptional regulator